METVTPEYETIEVETSGRRRKITKFALAGVAVLGVGAALTSAAWSDNVYFGGTSSTGDLDLEGRGTAGTGAYTSGDDNLVPIEIPASAFTNVGPDVADTHSVEVRNSGTVDVYLDSIVVGSGGALFTGLEPATATLGTVTETDSDLILEPGDSAVIEVIVSGDENWTDGEYTGLSGVVTVHVHGTSDMP